MHHELYQQDNLALVWMQHLDEFVLIERCYAAQMRQCSRRFSSSNLFTIFGGVQAIGPSSDGVLKGGSERDWKGAPRGR